MGNEESHDELSQASQPPPGFEGEFFKHASHKSLNNNSPLVGSEANLPIPAVYEKDHKHRGSKHIQNDPTVVKPSYKKALLHVPSTPTSSDSTSKSLVRLAHDSFQIGELLRVRVTGDLEAAVSRITKPLKKNKAKARGALKEREDH